MASATNLSCLSWIPALWNKLTASAVLEETVIGAYRHLPEELTASAVLEETVIKPYRHLPDEAILQILSRLPVKSVLRCRSVCRRWKVLISTYEFALLHLNHSSVPMIIVVRQLQSDRPKELYLVDTHGSRENTSITPVSYHFKIDVNSVRPVSKSDRQEFLFSSSGLVIFREEFRKSTTGLEHYILLNPITREKVRLITPKGLICGIFHDPYAKDQYCLLWVGRLLRQNGSLQFRILALGGGSNLQSYSSTQICWKELYEDDDAPISYLPRAQTPPLILDNVLYWMVGNRYAIPRQSSSSLPRPSNILAPCCAESIMAFDMKTEKFSVMAHPGPQNQYCKDDPEHKRMNLVEVDEDRGFLCLCECSLFQESINIWILRNESNGIRPTWMRWHRVDIDLDESRSSYFRLNLSVRPVIMIVDGELLLEWQNGGYLLSIFRLVQ